jgi:hypothetical protein
VTASRGPRVCLMVVFLVLLGVVAPSQVVLELRRGETPQIAELFRQAPTRANLRRLESNLESRCQLAQTVRPWMQYLRFVLFEEAGDQAVLGHAGWFFYKPAVQYLVEPCPLANATTVVRSVPVRASKMRVEGVSPSNRGQDARDTTPYGVTTNENDIFAAIVSFRDELAKRGIRLLVMPAPNKSSIYPEMLTGRAQQASGSVNPTTQALLAQLREAGVETVDLFEIFRTARNSVGLENGANPQSAIRNPQSLPYYLAQDSHWSPEGMRLAADAVARRLLESGWVRKGPVQYEMKPVTVERYGDVLRMIRVLQVERLFRPERMNCTQVIDTRTGKPYADDPNSPVLVLGDSFLRIFERDEPGSGGFIAHLACNLGFGLTSLVNDGGASTLVRQQLARKPALLKGKKVVVWEFVERDIRFGTEGWQVIALP